MEASEGAPLGARHFLLCEMGVVLAGGVRVRPQQVHEATATMNGPSCMVFRYRELGPVRFRGALLCLGRRVTFHVNGWEGTCQGRWV